MLEEVFCSNNVWFQTVTAHSEHLAVRSAFIAHSLNKMKNFGVQVFFN
jgi:hypothetical protein